MSSNSQIAFAPAGNSVVVAATNPAPSGVQALVDQRFLAQETGQMRVINSGAAIVHLGVGQTAAIAQTNALAATAGVPAAGIPLLAGSSQIMRFATGSYFSAFAAAPITVYLTPGEGL